MIISKEDITGLEEVLLIDLKRYMIFLVDLRLPFQFARIDDAIIDNHYSSWNLVMNTHSQVSNKMYQLLIIANSIR
jgi:hypothetical protein